MLKNNNKASRFQNFYKGIFIVYILFLMSYMSHAAKSLPTKYKSSTYHCSLSNRYCGNGFSYIKFKNRNLGNLKGTYMVLKENGKRVTCKEELLEKDSVGNIEISENGKEVSFTTIRAVRSQDGKEYAKIERQYNLGPNKIEVKVKLIAKENFELLNSWDLYDLLIIPTKSLIGTMVEAKTTGNTPEAISALVPEVYSKDKWNLRIKLSNLKFIFDDSSFYFSTTNNSLIRVNHYGGTYIEISFKPQIHYSAVKYTKDSTLTWAYCIGFSE